MPLFRGWLLFHEALFILLLVILFDLYPKNNGAVLTAANKGFAVLGENKSSYLAGVPCEYRNSMCFAFFVEIE